MSTCRQRSTDGPVQRRITVLRLAPTHRVKSRQIVRAVAAALDDRAYGAINVVIMDDRGIAGLHKMYMSDPTPTDVLTFDLRDDPMDRCIEGEIVVSAETAGRQAPRFRTTPAQELLRYVIHGTLHLLGYDDRRPGDRRRMRHEEHRVLACLGSGAATPGRRTNGNTVSRPRRSTSSVRR